MAQEEAEELAESLFQKIRDDELEISRLEAQASLLVEPMGSAATGPAIGIDTFAQAAALLTGKIPEYQAYFADATCPEDLKQDMLGAGALFNSLDIALRGLSSLHARFEAAKPSAEQLQATAEAARAAAATATAAADAAKAAEAAAAKAAETAAAAAATTAAGPYGTAAEQLAVHAAPPPPSA